MERYGDIMADNNFNTAVGSLLKGMEGFLTTKTVVGDAVRFDDGTIILPLVDVSFGVAAGFMFAERQEDNAGGEWEEKIQPSPFFDPQGRNNEVSQR